MDRPRGATTRRDLLIAAGTCVLAATSATLPLLAQEKPAAEVKPDTPEGWQTAMRTITGDAKLIEGRIAMELPEIAENGNVVPFTLVVDSPMTDQAFVRSLRVFSTGNLQPLIGTFRFTRDSGKAAISSRMRLAKTQDVIALAELNDGTFLTAKKNVKVTIGGCGG